MRDYWLLYKEVIRKLYLHENKTLEEVIEEMKRQYGFVWSKKGYERQLNKWDMHKHRTVFEWQIVGQKM
ncbi:hypothetical protein GQ53DRAFT_149027 [Thozetella sp. PMI_491]|nr:hypothetical protein GQ53DRAFT_149027 [Thozetella sp. PMI_491]